MKFALKLVTLALLAAILLPASAWAQRGPGRSQGPSGERRMGPPPGDRMGPPLAGEQDQRRGWLRHRRTGQGPHLGDWLRKNRNLSPEEQDRMLANDAHFQQLPPEAQQRLRERLREFNNLSPEEQDRILDRMDRFGHLTPEQQKRAREMVRRMRALPEERRRKIHQTFGELRGLAPEEREGKLNSEPLSTELSSEERDLLREMFTLPPPPRRGPRGERGERPPEGEAPPPF